MTKENEMDSTSTEFKYGICPRCNIRGVEWMQHDPDLCDPYLNTDKSYLDHMTIGTPWVHKDNELGIPEEYDPPAWFYAGGPMTMTSYNVSTKQWECNHGGLCEPCSIKIHQSEGYEERSNEHYKKNNEVRKEKWKEHISSCNEERCVCKHIQRQEKSSE